MPKYPKMNTVSGATQGSKFDPTSFRSAYNFDYDNPQDWATQASQPQVPSMVGREYDDRQMPLDWDYKTADTGPNGEPLPDQANGWNYHGKPDFGPGIDGWWKNISWKFTQDRNEVLENSPTLKSLTDGIKATWDHWDAEAEAGNAPKSKKFGQTLMALVGSAAQGIGALWSNVEAVGPDDTGVTVWNAIPRAVGVTFDTLGYGFEALDRYVKENLTVPSAIRAAAALRASDIVPQETIDEWRDWIGPLGLFPLWATSAFHQLTGEIDLDTVDMDRALLASQLGYTAWKDEAVKEEFVRRVAANEDPRLLAMELQDPINELAGEFLFDPLNLVMFGSKKIITFLGDANRVADSARVGNKAADLIHAVESADDISRPLREAELFKWVDELAVVTAKDLAGEARQASDWGGLRGLFSQTADSRRASITEEMSDTFHELIVLTKSPDDTMRVMRGLSTLLDSNATNKARSLAMRQINFGIGGRKIPLHTLFGERGQRTAMVWRQIMGDNNGQKLIDLMKSAEGDIIKMNDLLGEELSKITNKLFPTIQDRVTQNKKYRQFIKADKTEEAANLLKKTPWADTPPNALHANLLKIYEPLQTRFYKPVGAVQGTVFMGMNPAYRMRNRMGNFAVLFVDQGPGAAVMSILDNRVMPWGKNWAIDTLNNWGGDVGHAAEFRGIGKSAAGAAASFDDTAWMSGKLNYFARKASSDEAVAGIHIMSRAMKRVVKSVLNRKKALKGLDDVVRSPEDAKLLERLTHSFHGDVEKAIREFANKKGIDDVSSLLFLDERQMFMLNGLEIEDAVRMALDQSLTKEERIARLDDIIESHRELGTRAAGESVIRQDPEFMEDIAAGTEGIGGLRGERMGDAYERKLHARQVATDTAEDALDSAQTMMRQMVQQKFVGDAQALGKTDDLVAVRAADEFFDDIVNRSKANARQIIRGNTDEAKGPLSKGLRREMVEFREDVRKLADEASDARKQDLLMAWQRRAGWMGEAPEHLDDFTVRTFKDALWTGYFDRSARKWHDAFRTQGQMYTKVFDTVIAALDPDGAAKLAEKLQPMIDNVSRKQSLADAMFRATMDDDQYMFMRVTPDELEDMIIDEWATLNKFRPDVDPEGLIAKTHGVRQYINNLRIEFRRGNLNLVELAGDETIIKAMENVAGSKAQRLELLKSLVSKEPNDLLTVEALSLRRDFIIEVAGPRDFITDQISQRQRQMDALGNPARSFDELVEGSKVQIQGVETELINGRVIEKYTTPSGQSKVLVETDKGQRVRVKEDDIVIPKSEITKADELDKLRNEEKLLGESLETAPDELEAFDQKRVDDLNQRIDEIEGRTTAERLEQEIAVLPKPEPGMMRLYQGRPATFDGTYDSVAWSQDVRQAVNFNGESARYFWTDVDDGTLAAAKTRAIEEGVDPRFANAGEEVRLADKFILKGEELDGRAVRQTHERYPVSVITPMDDSTPTPARMANKSAPLIKNLVDDIKQQVNDHADTPPVAYGAKYTTDEIESLRKFGVEAQTKVNDARSVGGQIASAERDFGLHNYGNRYGFDLVAGLIYPYQFWYSRSYAKWMKRMVQNPAILSAYLRYRRTLEKMHAGMPEWWKFQLNTNELLGMNAENPLYFNLEAMINPLNGLTNVDFTDPKRRLDWWGAAMEDIQKMGPSVWAPFTFALAAHYSFKGEQEAAARWAGRILPQSKTVRDFTALLDPKGLGVEIDPNVHLFSGGIEAYERGRVGRQLGMMLNEGMWKQEDIIDAGYRQTGEIWDLARARAINDRGGNIARIAGQFMFGVGLKPRPQNDMQIDNMYREMNTLIASRLNMSNEQYSQAWNVLREAYPFLDTVLLAKKSGQTRDEALAWNVLNRIPPGLSFELADRVSLDYDVLTKFRENKGDLSMLNEAEQLEFMAGVMQLNALLAIPDQMTARDWTEAKNTYSVILKQGETFFGEDIWEKVDLYYAAFDENNQDNMRNFLRANPIVQEALDFKQMMINSNPLMMSYYGSAEKLERFYKGQFYQTVEQVFGENIWDKWSVYWELKDMGENKAAARYFKEHPELKGYRALRDEILPIIDEKTTDIASQMTPPKGPFYRDENTMPDPAIGVQSFNVDEQQRWIEEQVMAYAQGESVRQNEHTDAMDIIRSQADALWPNTRRPSTRYYKTVDNNPSGAAAMLQENPELEARIKWEFERILRIALSREGELEASAAQFQSRMEEMGITGEPPTSFENLAPGPLQRLLNDPDGLPFHLQELLQGQ